MKTYRPKPDSYERKTYLYDAAGKTLGRLATEIAQVLNGKGKTFYTHDMICGDQVVVINAAKVHISGRKAQDKVYTHYTGYPGGLRSFTFEKLIERKPEEIITRAVSRMLPKNKLGTEMLRRLRVYAGDKHEQQAQKPEPANF
ncbi:MAG: 50S ribosomal protein L13 [Candidatus Omnitrophica bacterium]|nr:50S ribosomal protein L13 [Candidatus Omnitrophota bacterium]